MMEFRDLKKQYQVLKKEIDAAVFDVLASSHYISGSQVKELEEMLAAYAGVKHCVTCANGTDAISLALKAWGIHNGHAVFVPDFTFFSSGECPACEGAAVVFVDVDKDTYNLDPYKLEQEILRVQKEGKYQPKAVIAVDLFGQPAEYRKIKEICKKYKLFLLEDGAQGFGGSIHGKMACSFGDISITSFFPAKPLGCYGDGGAIFTDNDQWASLLRSLAVHGKSREDKYKNIRLGRNSRLDTLQAAILKVKLQAFQDYELEAVNKAADYYHTFLKNSGLYLPEIKEGFRSSWAQYTIQLPDGVDRASLQAMLKEQGIPSMIYYNLPMHRQEAFAGTDSETADCPVTEQLCKTVLSLPIHPYLDETTVEYIAENLLCFLKKKKV